MLRVAGTETAQARADLTVARWRMVVGMLCAIGVGLLATYYPGGFWDWWPLLVTVGLATGWAAGEWWMSRRRYRLLFERFLEVTKLYIAVSVEQRLVEWRNRVLGDVEGEKSS